MSPVDSPATRSRPHMLRYRFDKIRAGKPLTLRITGDTRRQIATLRVNVSKYGSRHGIRLVVRIIERLPHYVRVRVVWDGRRE